MPLPKKVKDCVDLLQNDFHRKVDNVPLSGCVKGSLQEQHVSANCSFCFMFILDNTCISQGSFKANIVFVYTAW